MKKTIAIDFDNTIVEEKYPEIGKLIKDSKKYINLLYEKFNIIIWTCRDGKDIDIVKDFLFNNNIMKKKDQQLKKGQHQGSVTSWQAWQNWIQDGAWNTTLYIDPIAAEGCLISIAIETYEIKGEKPGGYQIISLERKTVKSLVAHLTDLLEE